MASDAVNNVVPLHRATKKERSRNPRVGWSSWEGVPGGRIWTAGDGTKTYYIRKSIKGTVFAARFVGSDPIAVADQLRRFYADPAGFDPRGERVADAIQIDDALIEQYLAWCALPPPGKSRPRADKPWIKKKRKIARWWKEQLKGRNLRRISLPEIKTCLSKAANYKQSVAVIKHIYTFLREEKGVRVVEDPTYAALKTPQCEPAQYRFSKAEFTAEHFDQIVSWLEAQRPLPPRTGTGGRDTFDVKGAADYLGLTESTIQAYHSRRLIPSLTGGRKGVRLTFSRDALDEFASRSVSTVCHRVALANIVLAGTAWHATEVVRFSRHGQIGPLPATHARQNGAAAVLCCEHKGKFLHPTAVSERVAAAASELIKLGGISLDVLYQWTKKAVDATGVPPFAPGRYRHTVSTHAGNSGMSDEAISKFLGHKTPATTKRFYITRQVPPKMPTFT